MRFTLIITITCCLEVAVGKHTKRKLAEEKCFGDICQMGKGDVDGKITKLLNERRYMNTNATKMVLEPAYSVTARSHSSIEKDRFCKCKIVTIHPDFDKRINMTIVNVNQYRQVLSFEVCRGPIGFASKKLLRYLSYQTSCIQLYTNVRLLYMISKDELAYKTSMVPNGCVHVFSKQKRSKKAIQV